MTLNFYPEQTKVNRLIPKNTFYAKGQANKKIERLFIDQVDSIRWMYKLSASTLNIKAQEDLQEIQIFHIYTRVPEIDQSILRYIDQLILTPIIFELHNQHQCKMVACYKRLHQVDKSKVVLDHYYSSAWLDTHNRVDLPTFLRLNDLYGYLISILLPQYSYQDSYPVSNELMPLYLDNKLIQAQRIQYLQKHVDNLRIKLNREKQANKKVALNVQINAIEDELNILLSS